MSTTTRTAVAARPATRRAATAAALAALTLGYLLLVPFWWFTGSSIAAHTLPPGSPALFTAGILLVIVGAWLQGRVVRGGDHSGRAVALLVFLILMSLGNLAIIIEVPVVHTTLTRWDAYWLLVAGAVFLVLLAALRRTAVQPVAIQVAAALAGRVAVQAAIACWELAARVTMPGVLLAFIAAFGLCRVVPVAIQWHRGRQLPAAALLVTEGANAASVILLGLAWARVALGV